MSCYSQRSDSLRAREDDFVLAVCSSNLHKQSFLLRCPFDLPALIFQFFMCVCHMLIKYCVNVLLCYSRKYNTLTTQCNSEKKAMCNMCTLYAVHTS